MCGRFFLRPDLDEILAFFDAEAAEGVTARHPRWNVAPTQQIPAVRRTDDGRVLEDFRWGLVPSWWKKDKLPTFLNARSETAASKPSFRSSFQKRRLLVPASGFYEWKREGDHKTPFAISRADAPLMAMAGLWSYWKRGDEAVLSATILTCEASEAMASLHDRMPVILDPDQWDDWLDPEADAETLDGLMRPWTGSLDIREVGDGVNDARHTSGDWMG